MALTVVDHPLAQHLLTTLRNGATTPESFRSASRTLSTLLILAATEHLETRAQTVRTPLEETDGIVLGQGLAVVPILRAGLAMLESALSLFPDVAVGYIGLERDERTAEASRYYLKLPPFDHRFTLIVDPMLATGGSASKAIQLVKDAGASQIALVSVIAAPEGVAKIESDHPEVPIFTSAVDSHLNDKMYIVPGLGDFGDRLYGTL